MNEYDLISFETGWIDGGTFESIDDAIANISKSAYLTSGKYLVYCEKTGQAKSLDY